MRLIALLCAAVLAGCGERVDIVEDVAGLVGLDAVDRAPRTEPAGPVAPGTPQLIAFVEAREAVAVLIPVARNGRVVTWETSDAITLSLDGGILVATRGLGGDLMTADVTEVAPLIRSGGTGRGTRIHRYLDGQDRIAIASFACEVAPRGRRQLQLQDRTFATLLMQERCSGPQGQFQNLYWYALDGSGLVQSRQFVGPAVGSLALRIEPA